MNIRLLSLLLMVLCAITPLHAQRISTGQDSGEKEEETTTLRNGIRFVQSSSGGATLPSTLYYKTKTGYKSFVLSNRRPSQRFRKDNTGVIKFWKDDPSNAKDDKGKPIEPPAFLTVRIPDGLANKTLCILQPTKVDVLAATAKTMFLSESDIPKSGMHVINLAPFDMVMSTSKTGDFAKDAKNEIIKALRPGDSLSRSNMWNYNGPNGEQVAFTLSHRKGGKDVRVRSSKFVVSDRQSQISLILCTDTAKPAFKLESIQMSED